MSSNAQPVLLEARLGARGIGRRAAVGVASLPGNAPVEIRANRSDLVPFGQVRHSYGKRWVNSQQGAVTTSRLGFLP